MMASKQEIGLNILDALKARDMTQTELADLSGISVSSLYRWANGECFPTLDRLVIIAEILGTDIFKLLEKRN